MCQQEVNWARPFAERRGWGFGGGEGEGRRDVRWLDWFWDGRAEREEKRGGGQGSEGEVCMCGEVDKGGRVE